MGGGPAGLIFAEHLAHHKQFEIHIIDAKKTMGRKFLVAGDGGLNLSNHQPITRFVEAYNHPIIQDAVKSFDCKKLADWFISIGVETYYGSSGKLFPKEGVKPIQVLNAITSRLKEQNVQLRTETRFVDWKNKTVVLEHKKGTFSEDFDCICFAMGGASWSLTGSDGKWSELFRTKIKCNPFQSSNAGVVVKNGYPNLLHGKYIKNCAVFSSEKKVFGELRCTDYGLEGAPVYALNEAVRNGQALFIDFKPEWDAQQLEDQFRKWKKSRTAFLRNIKIGAAADLLLLTMTKADFQNDEKLLKYLKAYPIYHEGLRPIYEAISTVGGVDMSEITSHFQVKKIPNTYIIGEMLDWDTRTGGYLLQACFSSGYRAAQHVINQYVED